MLTTPIHRRLLLGQMLAVGMVSLLSMGTGTAANVASKSLTIYAAASLSPALQILGPRFSARTGISVIFSYAASSQLAKQIESGAPADIFLSADEAWMDFLEQRNLIQIATRRNIVGNRLVLIAPITSTATISLVPHCRILQALGEGRLATGDPLLVPIGRYAKAALDSLGVWDEVANRILPADNARTALMYVERGEAPLGIVYTTDALSSKSVRIVATFPEATHPPIHYPMALTSRAGPNAALWLDYLRSSEAVSIFQEQGFIAP